MPKKSPKTAFPAAAPALPSPSDWKALHATAAFLEKAKMAEYVSIMSNPRRNIWINFVAGLSRGVGMVIGASVIGVVLIVLVMGLLKKVFLHAGGVPWIGAEIKEAIGFILNAVSEQKDKLGR